MDYEQAVLAAPSGWTHFHVADLDRLPAPVRQREMVRVPGAELRLLEKGDVDARERVLRSFFWTFVYHLEPTLWDALAEAEPIHPALVAALPKTTQLALDIGAGSGRLTAHLVGRSRQVVAVEPSFGLRSLLRRRLPQTSIVAGWAEALPIRDGCSQLTAACGSFGPDPAVLRELLRVTAIGGVIALISPESPEWFEANGWRRLSLAALPAPHHSRWIDDFFGPPDPPHELVMTQVTPSRRHGVKPKGRSLDSTPST
jgi:SAM-dependent methyltransferase